MTNAYQCNGLCKAPEWDQIEPQDRQLFARSTRWRAYEPGETLFQQGEESLGIFCMQWGLVGLRRSDGNGNSALLRLIRPGDLAGCAAFLGNKKHANTAEALTRSVTCFIEASQLRWILKRNFPLMEILAQKTLTDLSRTEAQCALLLTASLRTRLLHLLQVFYESYGEKLGDGSYALELPIQRKDLAALLGTQPETISRLINRLEGEGLVRFDGRHVTFPDPKSLEMEGSRFDGPGESRADPSACRYSLPQACGGASTEGCFGV